MKLTKQDIDKVRHMEGFPIAKDEDIIALSCPPYYTACPNPFIEDFINENGTTYDEATDDYHREPFSADVSEGKSDPIYIAHGYHTKVPHKAIMRYILHYTDPGDIVLDGFCGTGMTGIAAQMCGRPDPEFKLKIENEMTDVKWGTRKAILNDLSPIATFISQNYNSPLNSESFNDDSNHIISKVEEKFSWMYQTRHNSKNKYTQLNLIDTNSEQMGIINHTVWSDVLICPSCMKEVIFWEVCLDNEKGKIKDEFTCDGCGASLKKKDCEHAQTIIYDDFKRSTVSIAKQVPVYIVYTYQGRRYTKNPDEFDFDLIAKINAKSIESWYPTNDLPDGDKTSDPKKLGIDSVNLFYTKRNLIVLSALRDCLYNRNLSLAYTALIDRCNKHLRLLASNFFHGGGGWVGTRLSGTLYIPSLSIEVNPIETFKTKLRKSLPFDFASKDNVRISCQSTAELKTIKNDSIDYIFTDPPFGSNLNYSELSYLWESWLRSITNTKAEAIISKSQGKKLENYQELMQRCFEEYFRVLKPNRWITVEFHNSKNSVWNSIQETLQRSGFIIADVRILNKNQGSFNQVKGGTQAIKQDLVISAYKPKDSFKRQFYEHAGMEQTAWDFVRQHLEMLPLVVTKGEKIEIVVERQAFLLFDRMVAYHIMNGISVPLDAPEFYKGLDEKFLKRDNMYLLHDQINEYDTVRITTDIEPLQLDLFVSDEKTAISWLYQQLEKPQTYAEIQPKFMQEIRSIEKYEKLPELAVLLQDNFLQNDQGKWYIPDVTKAADVIKLREKKLIKEFEEYLNSTGKLKLFRTEAIRAGFAKLWKDKNYDLIVKTAERLPEKVIQEDDKLLMYYDISLSRI